MCVWVCLHALCHRIDVCTSDSRSIASAIEMHNREDTRILHDVRVRPSQVRISNNDVRHTSQTARCSLSLLLILLYVLFAPILSICLCLSIEWHLSEQVPLLIGMPSINDIKAYRTRRQKRTHSHLTPARSGCQAQKQTKQVREQGVSQCNRMLKEMIGGVKHCNKTYNKKKNHCYIGYYGGACVNKGEEATSICQYQAPGNDEN